eukprot:5858326-Heterocapsa_arctica.AAC.1
MEVMSCRKTVVKETSLTTTTFYKMTNKGGTIITSINLSGSQTDFEYMLDHCKDNVMLIQEYWRLKDEIENGRPLPT